MNDVVDYWDASQNKKVIRIIPHQDGVHTKSIPQVYHTNMYQVPFIVYLTCGASLLFAATRGTKSLTVHGVEPRLHAQCTTSILAMRDVKLTHTKSVCIYVYSNCIVTQGRVLNTGSIFGLSSCKATCAGKKTACMSLRPDNVEILRSWSTTTAHGLS